LKQLEKSQRERVKREVRRVRGTMKRTLTGKKMKKKFRGTFPYQWAMGK
jgi:hypothetical protein